MHGKIFLQKKEEFHDPATVAKNYFDAAWAQRATHCQKHNNKHVTLWMNRPIIEI